jgi:4-amino-4-deoxy-L-arabinose transferase-like glycosyltransferase
LARGPRRSRTTLPLLLLALIAGLYLATVLINLDDDPIVGGDEGWIISASAKLSEDGVFGSGLFAGFYGAEDHYYFNLPLHHLILAAVFKVFGAGVIEARAVSVVFGLLALLLTFALGRRIGGPATGVIAATLLVLVRLNLTPLTGLSLTDLGATARYDLIAMPFALGAVLLIAARPLPPVATVALAGLLLGLAALTQFIGALFLLPLALYLLSLSALSIARRILLTGVLAVTMALLFLPYGVYLLQDRDDFRGQARSVEQQTDLLSPAFYWRQLREEPDRYQLATALESVPDSLDELTQRPSARLALLIVAPLALIYTLRRAGRAPPHRLLALLLVTLVLQLALFESTKRFVYWVAVAPFACIAIADLAVTLWRRRFASTPLRIATQTAVAMVLLIFAAEGLAVAAQDVRDAREAPDYALLASRLREELPAGATILGDNRLWPALSDRDYRSLLLLFYHTNPDISKDRATDVFGAMDRIGADYLLLSPLSRDILAGLSPRDAADFERYLSERAELVETIIFSDYGPIEVYRLE